MTLTYTKQLVPGTPENVNDVMTNFNQIATALDATNTATGTTADGTNRRGASIIATTETRTNTVFGTMPTPDQVSVTLPTNGLIAIAYKATWQESVGNAGRAAIFIGANQLVQASAGAAPQQIVTTTKGVTSGTDVPLVTDPAYGIVSATLGPAVSADVTTGQLLAMQDGTTLRGGVATVFAAAGTYVVSVQFKSTSGSVTTKDRKLWVWTLGF